MYVFGKPKSFDSLISVCLVPQKRNLCFKKSEGDEVDGWSETWTNDFCYQSSKPFSEALRKRASLKLCIGVLDAFHAQ